MCCVCGDIPHFAPYERGAAQAGQGRRGGSAYHSQVGDVEWNETEELRRDARAIVDHALAEVDARAAVMRSLRLEGSMLRAEGFSFDTARAGRIVLAGAGKAAATMAAAVESILGDRVEPGLVVVKDGHALEALRTRVLEAAHPIPDERSLRAGEEMLDLLSGCGEGDLVVFVLSGGASALLEALPQGVSLDHLQRLTRLLLESGATIDEINTVRRALSRVKAGGLMRAAHPARVLVLVLSDIPGSPLDKIGSGPFVQGASAQEAAEVLRHRDLLATAPASVRTWLTSTAIVVKPESEPEPGALALHLDSAMASTASHVVASLGPVTLQHHAELASPASHAESEFAGRVPRVEHVVVGDCRLLAEAALEEARRRGYHAMLLTTSLAGEARETAQVFASVAREIASSARPLAPPACVVASGETTVTVRGRGRGGRNTEMALAFAVAAQGLESVVFTSVASDGTDGPTDAAGALVDGSTVARAASLGLSALDCLADNDSLSLFEAIGDVVRTGPTGTNVDDLQLLMVRPRAG